MRLPTNFALFLATLLFMLVLLPHPALAKVADCPKEPAQGVPIASGDTFVGANCTLYSASDVDSFTFKARSGDIWHLLLAQNEATQNICLTLYDPSSKSIYSQCTNIDQSVFSVMADLTLTTTGSYVMVITEPQNGEENYGVSLERLHPAPADGQEVTLGKVYTGTVVPGEDSPAFKVASVTTGTYEVLASVPTNAPQNLCMNVYFPNGTSAYSGCTNINQSVYTIKSPPLTPPEDGTGVVLVYEDGNDDSSSVGYQVSVSCLNGKCVTVYPPCTLTDSLSYDSTTNTLSMDFTVGNKYAATWNAWLTYQNTMTELFSVKQPVTVPPVPIPKTTTVSPEGTVGVLSTLTTPTKGIACSSWEEITTGTP